ncbi:hypothetical protein P7H30_03825 [Streptococcus parauberis]|uniref:hypothetical protein n=1 Tax=Streptococcus parauberis TaxID=1348 RepID=UPI00289193E0|nr:hypothetical protein [Streptococcus parauberis]MDT2748878.1 hypothetical protein [Streptococcus parauberis]
MKDLYLVIEQFTDGIDENVEYPVNAIYPREGHVPSEDRIYQLSTFNNAIGRPLIRKLVQMPKKDDAEEEVVPTVEQINQEQPLEDLSIAELKAILDERGQDYAKSAKKEILIELVKAGE